MAWEIESHHVDLAEMEHVTHFVEKDVLTRDGKPARHLLQIRLGDDLKLTEEGHLVDREGGHVDIQKHQQETLAALNAAHERARKFARRHRAEIFRGPK